MAKKVKENISWVGKVDWELKKFHGNEYSTHRGTTYNSYLVRDKKTALIDTVYRPYAREFVDNLKKEIDLKDIDYIISNHSETDHSGALEELLKEIPDVPVYCTKMGAAFLKGHYHGNWNFKPVKTGDRLSLGERDLVFIEARMLHWPDNMFSYLTKDNILFSNDAFGQHYATEDLFNYRVDRCELFQEAIKYYANILTPFSSLVTRKIEELISMGVPVEMICPSHGVIWEKNPLQIVDKYKLWADSYSEEQVSVLYDTMWNGTARIARAVADGIKKRNPQTRIKMMKVSESDKNDIVTEVFKSRAIAVGSPTVNRGILTSIAAILEEIRGLGFKGKKAAAFGSYGWSGESPSMISNMLREAGFDMSGEPLKIKWNPDSGQLNESYKWGETLNF